MKKLFFYILMLNILANTAKGQSNSPVMVSKPQNFLTYILVQDSIKTSRGYFSGILQAPADTTANKLGIAQVGYNLYVGNGIYWSLIIAGSVSHAANADSLGHIAAASYLKYSDTTTQTSGYLRKGWGVYYTDTASMLSNRLKYSDTAFMLSPYLHFQAGLKYYDTSSMLSNRLKISDTANAFSNYLRKTTLILPAEGGTGYTSLSSLAGDAAFTGKYLPLAAGSGSPLSGDLYMSGATSRIIGGTNAGRVVFSNADQSSYIISYGSSYSGTPSIITIVTASGLAATFNADHSTTLAGALNGTTGTFSGAGSFGASVTVPSGFGFTVGNFQFGATTSSDGYIYNTNTTHKSLSINYSTDAATFFSSVTLGGNLIGGVNDIQGANFYNNSGYPYNTLFGSGADASNTTLRAGSTAGIYTAIKLYGNSSSPSNTITLSTQGATVAMTINSSGNVIAGGSVTASSFSASANITGGTGLSGALTGTLNNISIGSTQYTPLSGNIDSYMKITMYDGGSAGVRGGFSYGSDFQGNGGSSLYFAQNSHQFVIGNSANTSFLIGGSYSSVYSRLPYIFDPTSSGKPAFTMTDFYHGASPYGQIFNSASGEFALGYGSSFTATGTAVIKWNTSGNVTVAGTFGMKGYTVGTLPAGVTGAWAYVTDASGPTYGATVVGGGSVVTPVFYNGTNWTCR